MSKMIIATRPLAVAAFAAAAVFASASSLAQPMEVVTVEAVREIEIGRSAIGAPIKEITIRSKISYADLDLTTDAGVHELEKRVRDTAAKSCKDIKIDFPAAGSTLDKCIREATDGGLAQVTKVVAEVRAAKK